MIFKKLTVEIELDAKVIRFTPARPAPACQDHDNPRYSDSGDDEECEFVLYTRHENEDYPIDLLSGQKYLVALIYKKLDEQIRQMAREQDNYNFMERD